MARRTKEEAQETRTRILDTAEHLFSEKGVSRTSLADLAEAAGVTRGAIYWHFLNKAELFDAMMSRATLPMEEMARRAGDAAISDPLAYVRGCAVNVLELTATDPQCQRVFEIMCHKCEYVGDMDALKARHIESRKECLGSIEQGIARAVEKKLLPREVDPRRAAIGLSALIDGLINNWLLDPGYHSLKADGARIVDTFLAGLGAQQPTIAARKKNARAAQGRAPAAGA
jgi:TetR/AcrR family acrAB operon transcriptional repressor